MSDARTWVGASTAEDSLDHARIVAATAPGAVALHAILNSGKVSGMLRIRRERSTAALQAQRTFRQLSLIAIFGTAVATLASGLLLYGAGSDAAGAAPAAAASAVEQGLVRWVKDNRLWITGLQVVFLLASSVTAAVLAGLKLVDRWTADRSRAETLRREVFNEALNQAQQLMPAAPTAPDPANPISQALELFRRYQHELQISYYARSIARHEASAGVLTWATAILAGFAAVTGAVGGFGGPALILSAFLGIAVPIVLAAAQSWRATSRDSDKADAYRKAKDALDTIILEIDAVRAKAALGDATEVRKYMDEVHAVMTTESGAWKP